MVNRIDHNSTRQNRSVNNKKGLAAAPGVRLSAASLDDVISMLANAPENRRARQVTEWESMRRQVFRQLA